MAQYKSYTHVLRIDKDEVQGILCGDVVVMPKLDGTNACLFMKDGTVHAGSRTREINMNKDNANFCKTLTLNGEKEFPQIIKYLESHPDHIVYGEWLGADGERFPGHIKDYLNHGFFIFDVFDTTADEYIPYDTYKSEFGDYDKIIPVIGAFHNPSREEIQSLLDKTDYNLTPNSKGEGIVIKNYKFRDEYGHIQIAKIVRDEYLQQKSTPKKPILAGQNEENFVDKFCTDAFMSKCQAKVMNTLDMDEWVNDKKSIGMFLNLCLNDLMEEEFWGHFKKKKGTVDLNRIQQLVFTNCRKYLNIQ